MPFWKTTEEILKGTLGKELFDPNWMNYNTVQTPPYYIWEETRPPRFEEVDIWEIITDTGGCAVYAAWCPYAEFYLVASGDGRLIAEFSGENANERLEQYLIKNRIPYPKV